MWLSWPKRLAIGRWGSTPASVARSILNVLSKVRQRPPHHLGGYRAIASWWRFEHVGNHSSSRSREPDSAARVFKGVAARRQQDRWKHRASAGGQRISTGANDSGWGRQDLLRHLFGQVRHH